MPNFADRAARHFIPRWERHCLRRILGVPWPFRRHRKSQQEARRFR